MKKILFYFYISLSGIIYSQPVINNVVGPIGHGNNINITGTGFETKNPAVPLVWDGCTVDTSLSYYYDQFLPTSAQQGAFYNIQYRNVPFRNVNAPNDYISYIIGGAHATDNNSGQYAAGNNVCLGVNLSSFDFFVQYWYRVDSLYDEENNPTYGDNMKEISLGSTENQIYTGDHGYIDWCNSLVPTINQTGPVKSRRVPADCPSLTYSCSDDQYTVYHQSPINGWIKMQWEGGYNHTFDNPTLKLTTYPDGKVTKQSHYGTEITVSDYYVGCGYPDYNNLRFLGIGGFSRVPRFNNGTNSFRYFAGVYIDSVKARVMLGDNPNYNSCTILEPQIPLNWSENSISVVVNLGSLDSSSNAYLFVFNRNNVFNSLGFNVGAQGNDVISTPQGIKIVK